jgi:hypothetical protein
MATFVSTRIMPWYRLPCFLMLPASSGISRTLSNSSVNASAETGADPICMHHTSKSACMTSKFVAVVPSRGYCTITHPIDDAPTLHDDFGHSPPHERSGPDFSLNRDVRYMLERSVSPHHHGEMP